MTSPAIQWFETFGINAVPQFGGKNASLGEMIRALAGLGVRVPEGFATSAAAYRDFISVNALEAPVADLLAQWKGGSLPLAEAGAAIRALLLAAPLPEALVADILAAYRALGERAGVGNPAVAVRSSATAEDLPTASFAGQQESFLNVRGERALIDTCRRCYASLFTDRAISYRDQQGFGHMDVALSVGVQRMVRADLAGSGVMFTLDPESGFPHVAVIDAAWGLGELVVQGAVRPDSIMVFKPLIDRPGARPVIGRTLGEKALKMLFAEGGSRRTRIVETSPEERARHVLSEEEALELARWAVIVERHYGRPMDIEWAKDGENGLLYLVQARPETVRAREGAAFSRYRLEKPGEAIVEGAAIGHAVATGPACVIESADDIAGFRDGSILVTGRTDPDWVPVMRRARGIVTDLGGTTSHAAIVSRELGVPAIVGTGDATARIADGEMITLSCAEGAQGRVYRGEIPFTRTEFDPAKLPSTRTDLMVNIADPSAALQWWRLPARGVGLARMEFIITSLVKAHPMALAHPERLSPADRRAVEALAQGYDSPADYFVDRLSRGIARLATPFHPHPAIVRLSDFKTNEYAHLVGGAQFEPVEENPMLGFRGASRYHDPRYRDGFALECRALKRVREDMGFDNVVVMVPFCRTPEEADLVLETMAAHGLVRGEAGLKIYMMVEIPSNVIRIAEFAERFDGFSIGSNDLTQLVLGVDRDSGLLAGLFDERDPAVMAMVADAIAGAKAAGRRIGICGQAPSDHPAFAAFLVECGIDSISLNPDSFAGAAETVAAAEG